MLQLLSPEDAFEPRNSFFVVGDSLRLTKPICHWCWRLMQWAPPGRSHCESCLPGGV
ncbi:MAG: hypothetical protein ACFCBU_15700 [Cyanophyceae cyanobacterium]